jgi:hypothetical protein
VELKRSHDLAFLRSMLEPDDSPLFEVRHLAALNPWTIEGRYPADLADSAGSDVDELVASARRVVTTASAAVDAGREASESLGSSPGGDGDGPAHDWPARRPSDTE